MLYLPRPPENSSGPQPRASNAERQWGVEQELFSMWWFTPSLLLLRLISSPSFRSQTQAFDHFRLVAFFQLWKCSLWAHNTTCWGSDWCKTKLRFCGSVKVYFHFYFPDVFTVRWCFSSQLCRHYYKLRGFESSLRLSGFSLFFLFCCESWDSCGIPTGDIS